MNLVITLKQPFAELVCLGLMDVINLPFNKNLYGKILIHASTDDTEYTPTDEQFAVLDKIESFNFDNNAIIGQIEVVKIVENHNSIWAVGKYQMIVKNQILYEKPILNIKGRPLLWRYKHEL